VAQSTYQRLIWNTWSLLVVVVVVGNLQVVAVLEAIGHQ